MTLIGRPENWHKTADWETIHYMAAIRCAKTLALEYRDPDLLAVVLAVPANDSYLLSAQMVPANIVFDPYPGIAVVLHIVAINHDGEAALLPESHRKDIPGMLRERLLEGAV